MWVLHPDIGFLSIVDKDPYGRGRLCVRARVRADLNRFRRLCPSLSKVERDDVADYEFRAYAKREDVAEAMRIATESICWRNFKDEVEKKQGRGRHDVYLRVWSALRDLSPHRPRQRRFSRRWPSEESGDEVEVDDLCQNIGHSGHRFAIRAECMTTEKAQ